MEILISPTSITDVDGNITKGYLISTNTKNGKINIQESDVFLDSSEIEIKVQQLRRLLKLHFNTQV